MRPIKRKPPPGQWREEPRRGRTVSDPVGQEAALVVDDVAGADHGAGTAGEAFVGEDKGAVFRNLDRSGRAGLFTQTAADTADFANILAAGILVGAENDDGIVLQS